MGRKNNFLVCSMMFPRHEWPFIYEWLLYYNKLGVNNFLFGIDKTKRNNKLKGKDELKHKYYHLDKSDNEVNNLFFNEILNVKKINKDINIFTIDMFYSDVEKSISETKHYIPKSNIVIQTCQTLLHKFCLDYGVKNNIDYIINIDCDEFIEINSKFKNINELFNYFEKKYPKIKSFYIHEYVCSGRFDENGDYRKVKDINTKNKTLSALVKWIIKPDKTLISEDKKGWTVHRDLNTKKYIDLNKEIIWYNHYRGFKNWNVKDFYEEAGVNKSDI